MRSLALFCLLVALAPACADAQVVINETFSNPPGAGNDPRYEYVELYGEPGMSLSGYLLVLVLGGGDPDANLLPGPVPSGWASGQEMPSINHAWSLDGLSLGSNGFLVLYNNNASNSMIPAILPIATARATFASCEIPLGGAGTADIGNNGSQNYILVRHRPFHTLIGSISAYQPGYAWYRGVNPDVNFDSRLDVNGVGTFVAGGQAPPEIPVNSEEPGAPPTPPPSSLESYQMADEIAASDTGGMEYLRSTQQKISSTPGGITDAISRVAYRGSNPNLGWRVDLGTGLLVRTRMADEEFFYGEILTVTPTILYDDLRSGGPTDPKGQHYNSLGLPDVNGTYLLDDVSRTGYHLTPGAFNDADSRPVGGANIVQFRFLRGDVNFDGVVNSIDEALLVSRLGATLDDTSTMIHDNGTPDVGDDISIANAWRWQGRDLQAILAMMNLDKSDGPGGENEGSVTNSDLTVLRSLLCRADFNHDQTVNVPDIFAFLSAWFAGLPDANFNGDQAINVPDIFAFLSAWFAGCP